LSSDVTAWTVAPHGPIEPLAANLWLVEGEVPGMQLRRTMVVARLASGDLVLHSAIALDDEGMTKLEALGRPRWLVVPNGWHRLDAARYRARYPDLRVVCPRGSRKRVEKVIAVDAIYDELHVLSPGEGARDGGGFAPVEGDDTVRFQYFGDAGRAEGAMLIRSDDGCTAVFGDLLFNLPHQSGVFWWVYGRLMGATGGPKVTVLGRLLLVMMRARKPYKRWLERVADIEAPVRLVPGHGEVVRDDAPSVLRAVAASL